MGVGVPAVHIYKYCLPKRRNLIVSPNERPPDSLLLLHDKLDPTTLLNGKKETSRPCRGITGKPTPTTHNPQPHLHSSGPSITSPHLSPTTTTFRPARQEEQDFVLTSRESTDQHNGNNGQFSSSGDMHRDLPCRPPSTCSRTSLPHDSCLSQPLGHHGFQ